MGNKITYLQCHQMPLAIASPLFKALFKGMDTKNKCPLIHLLKIQEQDIFYILEYVYNSKVFVPKEHITSFINAADKLQIREIKYKGNQTEESTEHIPNLTAAAQEISGNEKKQTALQFKSETIASESFQNVPNEQSRASEGGNSGNIIQNAFQIKSEVNNNVVFKTAQDSVNDMKPVQNVKVESKHKKTSIGNGKLKALKNININKIIGKPEAKVENTEASNAVYKEWKAQFSSSNENVFSCHHCSEGKSFTLESSLRRHYKQTHEKPCKCCKLPFYDDGLNAAHCGIPRL